MPEFVETQAITVPDLPYSDQIDPDYDLEKYLTATSQKSDIQDEEHVAEKGDESHQVQITLTSQV
jgi:hypothetical protein